MNGMKEAVGHLVGLALGTVTSPQGILTFVAAVLVLYVAASRSRGEFLEWKSTPASCPGDVKHLGLELARRDYHGWMGIALGACVALELFLALNLVWFVDERLTATAEDATLVRVFLASLVCFGVTTAVHALAYAKY